MPLKVSDDSSQGSLRLWEGHAVKQDGCEIWPCLLGKADLCVCVSALTGTQLGRGVKAGQWELVPGHCPCCGHLSLPGAWGLQVVKVISVFPSKLDSCLLLSG